MFGPAVLNLKKKTVVETRELELARTIFSCGSGCKKIQLNSELQILTELALHTNLIITTNSWAKS